MSFHRLVKFLVYLSLGHWMTWIVKNYQGRSVERRTSIGSGHFEFLGGGF